MKFNVFQKDLLQGVQIVQRAVDPRTTMPILKGIYLKAVKNKGLHLISSNLEIGIEYWVKANIIEEGEIVIPQTQLYNILRELPAKDIDFIINFDNYNINVNCVNSKLLINGFKADEFPQLPTLENFKHLKLPALEFKNMINEVKIATTLDKSQGALSGGLLYINKEIIKMAATDTCRLAYSNLTLEEELIEDTINTILPRNTLNELDNLIVLTEETEKEKEAEIEIFLNPNHIKFIYNNITLISRLIDGDFPNYQQVLPTKYTTKLKIDRHQLLKAVKRAYVIAQLNTKHISIFIEKDVLKIKTDESIAGHAYDEIEIECEGPEQTINIDANYLLDVLKVLKDDVIVIEFTEKENPMAIKKENEDNFIYLIMPCRNHN